MRKTLLYLIFTLISVNSWSQNQYFFDSQESVDQFLIDNPNLTELDGSLYIDDQAETPITNLDAFSNLTKVVGTIKIRNNPNLQSLSGLDNVHLVEFNSETLMKIDIVGNPMLDDISPLLSKFTSLSRVSLLLSANPLINDLSALSNLETIGSLNIVYMSGIQNLDDLSQLSHIDYHNDNKTSLSLTANPSLQSIQGLSSLVNVKAPMTIFNNSNLTSLAGLENAVFTGNYFFNFEIVQNNSLIDISALKLENVGDMGFTVFDNVNLECCQTDFLCDGNSSTDDIITGNAEGCQSKEEVLDNCGEECGNITSLAPLNYKAIASISPNPALNQLSVNTTQQVEIRILDSAGKCIIKEDTNNTLKIDISSLQKGLYFIQFNTEKESWIEKLVIQ